MTARMRIGSQNACVHSGWQPVAWTCPTCAKLWSEIASADVKQMRSYAVPAELPKTPQSTVVQSVIERTLDEASRLYHGAIETMCRLNIGRMRSLGYGPDCVWALGEGDARLAVVRTEHDREQPAVRYVLEQQAPLSLMMLSGLPD